MSRSLITRIEKLERATSINDGITIRLVSFVTNKDGSKGKLLGLELVHDKVYFERPEDEPEDAFWERISSQYQKPLNEGVMVIREKRISDNPKCLWSDL